MFDKRELYDHVRMHCSDVCIRHTSTLLPVETPLLVWRTRDMRLLYRYIHSFTTAHRRPLLTSYDSKGEQDELDSEAD